MLNSKRTSKNNTNSSPGSSPSVNMLSEGTRLKGDITSQTDIRIAGTVEGEARSNGKVIITGNGKVIGNISSSDADIAGTVEGEIKVSGKLTLRQNAVIDGNIYTKTLIVEEGAQVNGACKMGADAGALSDKKDKGENGKVKDLKVKNAS